MESTMDRDGFLKEVIQDGAANRKEYDVPEYVAKELVENEMLVECGRGDYVAGPLLDINVGRGLEQGDARGRDA